MAIRAILQRALAAEPDAASLLTGRLAGGGPNVTVTTGSASTGSAKGIAASTGSRSIDIAAAESGPIVPASTGWNTPGLVDPDDDPLWRVAEVDFGGVRQLVSLACLPEARCGDQVLVHVGIAISLVQDPEPEPATDA